MQLSLGSFGAVQKKLFRLLKNELSGFSYPLIFSSHCYAEPLRPSQVLIEIMRNSMRTCMSFQFLTIKSISLSLVEMVMQSQLQNGKFKSCYGSIELMCFLKSQKREVNPPNVNDWMSLIEQEQSDLSRLNLILSSHCSLPMSYLTTTSFFSLMGKEL